MYNDQQGNDCGDYGLTAVGSYPSGASPYGVMDMAGNEMANFEISIGRQTPNAVALFRGAKRESYNCAPYCESELQIGDDMVYNAVILEQTKKKIELATGADTAKSEAPPAPQ